MKKTLASKGLTALVKGLLCLTVAMLAICGTGAVFAFADSEFESEDSDETSFSPIGDCASVEYIVANPTLCFGSFEGMDSDVRIDSYLNRLGDQLVLRQTLSSNPVVYELRCMPASGDWRFVNVSDESDMFDPDMLDAHLPDDKWEYGTNVVELKVGEVTCTYTIDIKMMDLSSYSPAILDYDWCSTAALDSYETGAVAYSDDDDDDTVQRLNGCELSFDPYPANAAGLENYAYDVSYVGYRVNGGPKHKLERNSLGVCVIPPVDGETTIIIRSKQTATIKDGVMTFPASKNLPNAYRLDIDLGKNISEPYFGLPYYYKGERDVPTIPSDYYLGWDYYLWPDCENSFGFDLKEPDKPCSVTLAPADAGTISYTSTLDEDENEGIRVSVKLTKPATLHVGTDGKILSAKPRKSTYTYTGKPIKPAMTVKTDSRTLQRGREYSVTYENNIDVGQASATVKGINGYSGKKTIKFTIEQATNWVKAKKRFVKKTLKAKSLKKKASTIALPKTTTKFGEAKWSVAAKDKSRTLSLKGGKVKVKKGAKAGTYTIKLKASVAEAKNYKGASSKVVTVKVKVK